MNLKFANKLLQEAKESSDEGLFLKSGLFTWNNMEMVTITDASFGNESNFRSQNVEGLNPAPHIHEQKTTSNYGYDIAVQLYAQQHHA